MSGLFCAFAFAAVILLFVVVIPVVLSRARRPDEELERWAATPTRTARPARTPPRGPQTPWREWAAVFMFSLMLPLSLWVEVGAGRADDVPHIATWTLISTPLLFVAGWYLGRRIVRQPQSVRPRQRSIDTRTFE